LQLHLFFIRVGLDEKQIEMYLRDQQFLAILNPPQQQKTEKPVFSEVTRKRGELDEIDYDLIFSRKFAATPTEDFNQYFMYNQDAQLQKSLQRSSRPVFSSGQMYRLPPQQALSPQVSRLPPHMVAGFTQSQTMTSPNIQDFAQSRPMSFVSPSRSQHQYQTVESKQEKTANAVLEELGLTPYIINFCIDNLKTWFVTQILKPTLAQIDHINSLCKKEKLDLYDCNYILDASASMNHLAAANVPPPPPDQRMTLRYILVHIRDPQHDVLVANRLNIETYLSIRCDRRYLIQRMRELSSDVYLTKFVWNGGGDFKFDSDSKPEKWEDRDDLPTDTDILQHLFLKWLDLSLPNDRFYGKATFSNKYFINRGDPYSNRELSPTGIYIILQKRMPPHYNVYCRGTYYECPPGRNNLFHAIVLFVYFIEKHNRGYLEGGVSIHEQPINLQRVVPSIEE
jgi:hypothetical protein